MKVLVTSFSFLAAVAVCSAGRAQLSQCQQMKLVAGDAANDDIFGRYVCVEGDTAVMGADSDDDLGLGSGSAYVFVRTGVTWGEQQKLLASDGAAGDEFGISVAVDGDTVVVGARGDDDHGSVSGSVYVFVRSGTIWSQQQKLTPSDGASGDFFGQFVALSGDTLLVGASYDDNPGTDSGSAYVFVRSGTVWSQQQKLSASDGAFGDRLGLRVALDGDTALLAADMDDNAGGSNAGAAYVFVRSAGVWSQQQKLTASDGAASDSFACFVSLSGNTALVAAFGDDNVGMDSGSTYVFVRSGTVWSQQQKLTASDAANNDQFGDYVTVDGDTAVISAPLDDDAGANSGSQYVFTRSGTTWTQAMKIVHSDAAAGDLSGDVWLDGQTLIVGAGQADHVGGVNAGAAYIHVLMQGVATYCTGKTNSLGCVPAIGACGIPSATLGSGFEINCTNVLENKSGLLFYSFGPNSAPFQGGFMCVATPVKRTPVQTSLGTPPCNGSYSYDFNVRIASGADPLLIQGAAVYAEWWMRDSASPSTTGLSNGLSFTIGP